MPRFLADVMLERLARWLRAAGVDTASAPGTAPDAAVRRLAAAEGRVLLTRDRALAAACTADHGTELDVDRCYRVHASAPIAQLLEVAHVFDLGRPTLVFTRCLVCNTPLRPAAAAEVFTPPAAATPADKPLWTCPGCGRVYWEGSHTRRMRQALARALNSAPASPSARTVAPAGHTPCAAWPPIEAPPSQPSPENGMHTNDDDGSPAPQHVHDLHGPTSAADAAVRPGQSTPTPDVPASGPPTENGEADTHLRAVDRPPRPHTDPASR